MNNCKGWSCVKKYRGPKENRCKNDCWYEKEENGVRVRYFCLREYQRKCEDCTHYKYCTE